MVDSVTAAALMKRILWRSGLSQAELGRRSGLPRSVINAYVHGHREPGAEALARIAAAAGFELELSPRRAPVDVERAGRILEQVLDLAEELPYRPRQTIRFSPLRTRVETGTSRA